MSPLGAILGVIPFILDYRAMGKALEVNALGAVAEKIQNLEKLAAQISSATNQWAGVQETVQGNSDKTAAGAKEIADRMAGEDPAVLRVHEKNERQREGRAPAGS